MTRALLAMAILSQCLAALSCTGNPAGPETPSGTAPPFVAFQKPSLVIDRLETAVTPPYAVGSTPSGNLLSSSDPSIVGIDPSGNLIAHRNAEAIVHATGGSTLRVVVQAYSRLEIVPGHLELRQGERKVIDVLADGQRVPPE